MTSQSLSYTGLAAPIITSLGLSQLYIGATRTKEYPYPYGTHPAIDNAIQFAGAHVMHDGAHLDRLQKISTIKNICKHKHIPLPTLQVCSWQNHEAGNCCTCEKCLRTINELILEGLNPKRFGFPITIANLQKRTQEYFANGEPKTGGLNWHWSCVMRRTNELITTNFSGKKYSPASQKYIQWLAKQPWQYKPTKHYDAKSTAMFTRLWEESLNTLQKTSK